MRRKGSQLPPILLGEAKAASPTIIAECPVCRHKVELPSATFSQADTTPLAEISRRMRCTGCRRLGGVTLHPIPRDWVRYLRQTGQGERLPFYAAMMPDS